VILLDTHALIWYANEDAEMPDSLWRRINQEDQFLVSAISVWEIAMLVDKNRLILNLPVNEWIETAGNHFPIVWIDLNIDICLKSTQLPGDFHKDPADRFIVSTCILNGAKLITRDKKLLTYPYLETEWSS
jgi:PIN domain nuclease of toxin-antitoxin system